MTADYMTTNEVAEALRTPSETIRYWRHVGKGPASFQLGRRVLYARTDVEAFLAERRAEGHRPTQIPPPHVRLGRPEPKAPTNTDPAGTTCPHCGGGLRIIPMS